MYEWLLPLIGIGVGWLLHELSSLINRKSDRKLKYIEMKIEYYAEWISGMRSRLDIYASQSKGSAVGYDIPLCENRLKLIEDDSTALQLMERVHNSIPNFYSQEFEDMRLEWHSNPEATWEPFETSMANLVRHVRQKLR